MRTFRSWFGIIGAVIPILYCVGFLVYFGRVERFTGVPVGNALGPTMLGLGMVAILLTIPLVLRTIRLFGPPPPAVGGPGNPPAPEAAPSDFDPDAAIARYLAKRPESGPPPASPPEQLSRPRPAFGRKPN